MKELITFVSKLNPLSARTISELSNLFRPIEIKKNDYFIEEGEQARQIAFLKEGIFRGYYRKEEGTEYNKHFFIPPCFIGGYSSLITGKPNKINQQAMIDSKLLVAEYADFIALYKVCPDLERAARRLAELFFVDKEEREIEIVLLDAEARYHIFQKQLGKLEQIIPQYHIASYLGITPTQLSRIRSKK